MASLPLNTLTPRGSPTGTDLIPILPNGASALESVTVAQLQTEILSGAGTVTGVTAGTGLTGGGTSGGVTVALSTPVSVANGGTGEASLTAHGVLVGEGTSAIAAVAPGSAGKVLTSNGPGADPSWQAPAVSTAFPTRPMTEIDYLYAPAEGTKAAGGAGSQSPTLGAGNGLTDVAGSVWAISTSLLLSGTCDTTDGNQFLRDQLTFPSASTPSGLNQTVVFDLDGTSVASVYAMLRRAGLTSSYFIGTANAGANAGAAVIRAYNSGSQVASATGSVSNYTSGNVLRVTASVSGSSPTTVTCTVYDLTAGVTVSTATLSDSTSALQTASAGALAVTNNAGAAVAQTGVIRQMFTYDPTVTAKASYCAFVGDSITYGQQCSDVAANGGTIVGNNPAAQAITNLGNGWGGVNLGNQAQRIDQATTNIATRLTPLLAGRFQHWAAVMMGINDIGQGATAATVESRITTLCNAIRAAGYRVVVSTILPVGSGCTIYNSFGTTPSGINTVQAAVNTWLRANWPAFADEFVDMAADTRLSAYSSTYYNADQLHLSDAGSAVAGFLWTRPIVTTAYPPSSVLLSEVQVGGQSAVTFTLSSTTPYRDLRLVVRGSSSAAATFVGVNVTFNGDTGANYDYQAITANNSTSGSAGSAAQNAIFIGWLPASTGPSNAGGSAEMLVPDYVGAVFNKSAMFRSGVRTAAGAANLYATAGWGDWNNTAAITSVTATLASGNFVTGSTVSLYGSI